MATDLQSTVSMWICLLISAALILVRICLRRWRQQQLTQGDYWCLSAAALIIARLVANHMLILYGTTRTLTPEKRLELLDPAFEAEASRIVIGSKLVLGTRSLLVCLLWCLKMAVLDLLAKLIMKLPYERVAMYGFWTAIFSTFVASITTVFVGCSPFERHWQINPDPGRCVVGNLWLITYEASNIVTDVLLMIVPLSLILSANIPVMQRLRVLSLFSIGMLLIAVSIVRIVEGKNSRVQRRHTVWASLEVLFAGIVAVSPTIYTLAHHRHEDGSYDKSHLSVNLRGRTFPGSVVEGDKYTARVWTELHDGASRVENPSVEGILVETRYETLNAKV